jgi:23S rRNA pseudouridine1911/1915/1917 synthase
VSSPIVFTVEPQDEGRADRVLARRFPWASRRRLADLFARRLVRIDGKLARKGTIAAAGATMAVAEAPPSDRDLAPIPVGSLPIVHADDTLVAADKPAGMPSHPLRARETGTAANALVAMFPETAGIGDDPREAGLVHRLDAGTSGVLLCARDRDSWLALRAAFAGGQVEKRYLALVLGSARDGACDEPLSASGGRASVGSGLPAHTRWTVEARGGGVTLLRCTSRTGRMHQIRAHLAHAGFPIVGDTLYGDAAPTGQPFFLHASSIDLPHPATGARLVVTAPLPESRLAVLRELELPNPTDEP